MDKNILKYMAFVQTAESGSFTNAAKLLNYSQSGISRMIGDLEAQWDVSLLDRSKLGVKLTSEGSILLPYAKDIVNSYENLKMEVNDIKGLKSGTIKIGTFSSAATHWLPNIIKNFQKDYPNIKYELLVGDYNEVEEWIITGKVDCGFLQLPCKSNLDIIFSEKDEMMVVLPKTHSFSNKSFFPLDQLNKAPFLLLEKSERTDIWKIFSENKISPNIKMRLLDDYAIMSMVENGLGISILPKLILKRIPYNISIKSLEKPTYRTIGFAVKNKNNLTKAVSHFINYLKYK